MATFKELFKSQAKKLKKAASVVAAETGRGIRDTQKFIVKKSEMAIDKDRLLKTINPADREKIYIKYVKFEPYRSRTNPQTGKVERKKLTEKEIGRALFLYVAKDKILDYMKMKKPTKFKTKVKSVKVKKAIKKAVKKRMSKK